jgi:hypothetical protein
MLVMNFRAAWQRLVDNAARVLRNATVKAEDVASASSCSGCVLQSTWRGGVGAGRGVHANQQCQKTPHSTMMFLTTLAHAIALRHIISQFTAAVDGFIMTVVKSLASQLASPV